MDKEIIVKGGEEKMGIQPIVLNKYRCERCGNEWLPRKIGDLPKICPRCKSYNWHTPRETENDKK